jgi:hypothetical protein
MDRYRLLSSNNGPTNRVPRYPDIPLSFEDNYFITTEGDRMDILAQQFYKDSSLWWVIAISNPSINQGSYFIKPGTQIRIPTNIDSIINTYKAINR